MEFPNVDNHSDSELKKIYELKNIAVVGVSKNKDKPSHYVPKYLIENGYNIIPVNPTITEVLQRKSYPLVSDINEEVDIVDIFRRSEEVTEVVTDSLKKKGVKVIWMQEGIYNQEAERMAINNGVDVIFNRCMMAEHKRLFGQDSV